MRMSDWSSDVCSSDLIKRIVPVIEQLAKAGVPVSVDTRKATVMEAALAAGAHLVNDISGLLHDPRRIEVVAKANCPVVLMHAPSSGDNPHAGRTEERRVGKGVVANGKIRGAAC